jgi:hypothetical protein
MKILSPAVLAACAVTATGVLVATTTGVTSAAATTTSSAYGLALYAQGEEAIPPTPYVESTDGSTQTTGGTLPDNPLLSGAIAELSAGDDVATVKLVDLTVGSGAEGLPQELKDGLAQLQQACTAFEQSPGDIPPVFEELPIPGMQTPTVEDVATLCEGLLDADIPNALEVGVLDIRCEGDAGRVTVTNVAALGAPVPEIVGDVEPNTRLLPDNPLLNVVVNRQTAHANGAFTVDGLVVEVAEGGLELVVGSVTCGEPQKRTRDTPPPAPAPTPVPASVPVTG